MTGESERKENSFIFFSYLVGLVPYSFVNGLYIDLKGSYVFMYMLYTYPAAVKLLFL